MIRRKLSPILLQAAGRFPIVTLIGPRQSGKTTLVRALFPDHVYANLENPQTRALYGQDPKSLVRDGKEKVIIDEARNASPRFSRGCRSLWTAKTSRVNSFSPAAINLHSERRFVNRSLGERASITFCRCHWRSWRSRTFSVGGMRYLSKASSLGSMALP